MQDWGDKLIYNTIEEILNPSHTALVVWDVIHASTRMIFNKEDFGRNLNSIVESARKSNIPVFFTPILSPSKRFYSVVASDCVSSPYKEGHERSLENMKNLITVLNSKEI